MYKVMTNMKTLIIIPSRAAASRLPNKPLLEFGDKPLVQHVWEQAVQAKASRVLVATDSQDIVDKVQAFGGEAMLTDPALPSGTDRVAHAYTALSVPFDAIINLQGDMPYILPEQITQVLSPLKAGFDVGTLVYEMDPAEQSNPNAVKAIVSFEQDEKIGQCHWFLRAPLSYGYHHAGVYAFTPKSLKIIATLPQSAHEKIEKLEQLRFLENGLTIGASVCAPIEGEINTPDDLAKAREKFKNTV